MRVDTVKILLAVLSIVNLLLLIGAFSKSIDIYNLKVHNEYLTDTYISTLKAIVIEDDMPKATVLMHQLDDYYQKYPEIDNRSKNQ